MVPFVHLEKVWHKNEARLVIRFDFNKAIVNDIRILEDRTFSASLNAWHVPANAEYEEKIIQILKRHKAEIKVGVDFNKEVKPPISPIKKPWEKLADSNEEIKRQVNSLRQWMQSKRYGGATVETYCDCLTTFLRYFAHKSVVEITNNDLIQFNNDYILANHFSSSYQNQVINAIKLFFRTMTNKNLEIEMVHRPRREKVLPNVLSKEETKAILGALRNLKHKTMLSLIYSCGLRRSELLHLKLKDIDSNRKLIIIRQAKGKKDRIVPLSEKILVMLREYYKAYKPKHWLFEGQDGNGPYDERSLASVLKNAVDKAGIGKAVTLHWLRHSYATHLLENGTDLRYIQEILGHSRSTTTEIYTHVSTKGIQNVVSPFDNL